jgi:hypothetical protein
VVVKVENIMGHLKSVLYVLGGMLLLGLSSQEPRVNMKPMTTMSLQEETTTYCLDDSKVFPT